LMSAGAFSEPVAELLVAIVAARLAFVITGGTGTGKTTLLGALLGCCEPGERILVIEDAAEIVTAHPHVVRLTSRTANVEGAGTVGLAELVRQALRMRPDRLVVGEFRGAEMIELLAALNTGHEGGAATMHANAAVDVPARFAALGSLAGLDAAATRLQVASALDVVIQLRRDRGGSRVLDELAVIECTESGLTAVSAWDRATGARSAGARLARTIAARGVAVPELLR
jgi:pilus assembly protein CpaF